MLTSIPTLKKLFLILEYCWFSVQPDEPEVQESSQIKGFQPKGKPANN